MHTGKDGFFKRIWKCRILYLMFLPCIILLGIFCYYPMYGIVIAFKDYFIMDGIFGSPWVGFKNFQRMFSSPGFSNAFSNTIIISLYRIVAGIPVPVLLALIINELKDGFFKRFSQTVSYFPYFISWVVATSMFTQVLSPSTGAVNAIFKLLGLRPVYFMAEPSLFRHVLVWTGVWKDMGWGSILYIAVLSQVDPQMYEAAIIDGASRMQKIININLPYVLPIVGINLILATGGILNGGFDQIFNMANASVLPVCNIIDTFVYKIGLVEFNYSYAAAAGLFKNVVGLIFVTLSQVFVFWLNRRMGDREIYGLY